MSDKNGLCVACGRFVPKGDRVVPTYHVACFESETTVTVDSLAAALVKVRPWGANPGAWAKVIAADILRALDEPQPPTRPDPSKSAEKAGPPR